MRRALIGILLAAAAATPAIAEAQGRQGRAEAIAERAAERYRAAGERNQQRSDRQEARSERQESRQEARAQRQEVRQEARVQRQESVQAPVQQQQSQTYVRRGGNDGQRSDGQRTQGQRSERWGGGDRSGARDAYRQRIEETRAASQRSADDTIGGNYARQAQRNQQRVERDLREDRRDGRDWNRDRRGDRFGDRRDGRRSSWNHSWRNDSRYDWQRYRYSNRNLFRSGGYYSPYRNYRYNRLSIGIILDSLFYSNRYWLNDPYQYRLPPAPYGTQWVRYYDDVVLVDVYTGEVLDVIYDFFW
jgi:hypothetical protein